ncbi:MAG: hypothetical protein GVY24_07020, partial [Planctomycetes bacterium]|nr:hypothetical protein [Planctomycetota bacterium]
RRFELVDAVVFSDHQDYGPRARADIELAARRHQPDALLTTEKDWVKLTGVLDRLDTPPIWRPMLGITHIHGEDDLTQLLADALTHHRPDPPPS